MGHLERYYLKLALKRVLMRVLKELVLWITTLYALAGLLMLFALLGWLGEGFLEFLDATIWSLLVFPPVAIVMRLIGELVWWYCRVHRSH